MKEIWKPITDYPRYEVSNLGQVRSWAVVKRNGRNLRSKTPRILILYKKRKYCPYLRVNLYNENGLNPIDIHKLVLETFVGKRPEGMEACHYDGDYTNNKIDNLRWDTPANNHADKLRHGTAKASLANLRNDANTKLTIQNVLDIRQRAANGEKQIHIAVDYGISRPNISAIVTHRSWKHI